MHFVGRAFDSMGGLPIERGACHDRLLRVRSVLLDHFSRAVGSRQGLAGDLSSAGDSCCWPCGRSCRSMEIFVEIRVSGRCSGWPSWRRFLHATIVGIPLARYRLSDVFKRLLDARFCSRIVASPSWVDAPSGTGNSPDDLVAIDRQDLGSGDARPVARIGWPLAPEYSALMVSRAAAEFLGQRSGRRQVHRGSKGSPGCSIASN